MRYGHCRRCDAPLVFVRTRATGKWMPLDRDPVPEGNVELRLDLAENVRVAHVLRKGEQPTPGVSLYMPHHATCPFVEEFRAAKGGSRAR